MLCAHFLDECPHVVRCTTIAMIADTISTCRIICRLHNKSTGSAFIVGQLWRTGIAGRCRLRSDRRSSFCTALHINAYGSYTGIVIHLIIVPLGVIRLRQFHKACYLHHTHFVLTLPEFRPCCCRCFFVPGSILFFEFVQLGINGRLAPY